MEPNWGLSLILCILITLSIVSLVLLKLTDLRPYLIDTAIISGCMAFCAAAYFTGFEHLLLGILLYSFRLTNIDNILKFCFLFGGIVLGYITNNNFYSYSSALILTVFTIVRLIESIMEITMYSPENEDPVES